MAPGRSATPADVPCDYAPTMQLARARSLRWRLDTLAAGILKHGPLLFLTLAAVDADTPRLWKAWGAMRDKVAWRGSNPGVKKPRPPGVLGYFRRPAHFAPVAAPPPRRLSCQFRTRPTAPAFLYVLRTCRHGPKPAPKNCPKLPGPLLGFRPLLNYGTTLATRSDCPARPPTSRPSAIRPKLSNTSPALHRLPSSMTSPCPRCSPRSRMSSTFSVGGIAAEYWADDEDDRPRLEGRPRRGPPLWLAIRP